VKPARAVVSLAAIVLGAIALVLAHDIHSTDAAIVRGDARYAKAGGSVQWEASTWLPGGVATGTLRLADDLALRRAEQAFVVARAATAGFDNGRRRSQQRAAAELALSEVVATGTPAQASRVGNLLGILAATAESEDAAESERRAAESFDAAIRADETNADAKYNLELLLRRIRVVGSREGAGSGSPDLGDALAGAGSGRPGSGY